MEDEKEKEETEENENENLRDLILQQLANLESSETSDDDSYKVRLSCILEDDESESSGTAAAVAAAQKEAIKKEKGETCEGFAGEGEGVQVTDLDDVTLCERDPTSEDTNDESEKGFAIKKLKSSDNVHKRPMVAKRREVSSDSSDLDISVSTSAEGPIEVSEVKIVEVTEGEEENTLAQVESEEETEEGKATQGDEVELEVVDFDTLAPIFAKVSRTYLEKTKGNVKWEENEKIEVVFKRLMEEEVKKRGLQPGEHLSLQDVHIRGVSSKEYNPPVPPETYLWEELKRLRERGGYPWTYLDKPPFDEATWKKYMEHVYEPINPPPLSAERKSDPQQAVDQQTPQGIPDQGPQLARASSKASLGKKDLREESKTSDEVVQDPRFLAPTTTPTQTSTTDATSSQSKMDVTSTALEASEFDLPVKQGSLARTRREQMRARAAEIQQRLRNHAGRIRDKFSNMQRPNIARKERPRREAPTERRFKLPEMHAPKISLPDRSKFKFPERAKLHLPESSRFHLPDKSRFHLPERPKFGNIAERAKLHLPDKSKFHLPDTSKLHFPEKAKLHFPEKAKFHFPDKSKFHLPDKSKFSLPNRPKLELPRFKRSAAPGSETSPGTSKSRFEFDLKSYPKLFTKHSKEYTTSSPKQTRGRTPPPRMQQQQQPQQQQPAKKWDDFKYADEELEEGRETDSRKSEQDAEYLEDLDKVPTLSTKSSTSRLSELSDDRKKGVLEEINPDEFFLRQKGISQDDIDMGQYLSREIREAFRSPDINALAKMDYMDVDNENADPMRYKTEPRRPTRAGSGKKKSILKKTSTSDPSIISDDGYKTYPPRRPGRKSRSQSKSLLNEDAIIGDVSRYEEDDVNLSRYDNVEDEESTNEYYKTPRPATEYQHYKVPRSHAPVCPSPPVKRKSSMEDEGSHKRIHEAWDEEVLSEPPKPAARKKHRKKNEQQEPEMLLQEQETNLDELESLPEQIPQEIQTHEVVHGPPMESPVAPKRTRTRSTGSRSLRSLAMESDVNRSFRSEPERDRLEDFEVDIIREESFRVQESSLFQKPDFIPHRMQDYEVTDLDDPGFGYATVGKPTITKPERQKKKPDRPPPPRKKKEIAVPVYNTYPRRTPIRPLRNYSTLGPSRPPRQKKIPPIEKTLAERQFQASAEFKNQFGDPLDLIEVSGSNKDLQTEKVIEKMKGRPLPPPPRPPRQKSKGPEDELEPTEEEKLSLSILRDEEFPLERKVTVFVHEPPAERETVEMCTATQTDPLPEDFSFGTEESDVMPEFSHEQLKIQQAFLEEMKKEEEELRKGADENDLVDAELKAEVIRQIEDIIAEEKRIMERKNEERIRREASEQESQKDGEGRKGKSYLDVDSDMGYASLERRGHRQEPPQELPSKMEKLQVDELEVKSLNVQEVQAEQIFVKELQGNRIASPDIDNRGGTIALGNIDLPPSFIDQIVAKIPWDTLRQAQESALHPGPLPATPAPPLRPHRRQRGPQAQDDSDDENNNNNNNNLFQPKKTHRRHHRPQNSSEEEDSRRVGRRALRVQETQGIPELSLQLARACTSAGVQALRSFVQTNAAIARSLDRELCVQGILCIAIALVAGFFLFGFDAKIVHLHRWDFQFPPQPPNAGF